MYSLITKSAVLVSILTLLPLVSARAELKKVPLILMDTGEFTFTGPNSATLKGDGDSTHLGRILSTGVFEKLTVPRGASGVRLREQLLLFLLIRIQPLQVKRQQPL
jgi:hypothetical protein